MQPGVEEFGHDVNTLIISVLLTFVYVFGVGVTALIARFVGRSFLDVTFQKEIGSYWRRWDVGRHRVNRFWRQV